MVDLRKGWMLHCCLLNEDHWGWLGCDIPKYTDGGIPRLEIGTPWHHIEVALAPNGRFTRIKDYYPGMPKDQWEYESTWWLTRRRTVV